MAALSPPLCSLLCGWANLGVVVPWVATTCHESISRDMLALFPMQMGRPSVDPPSFTFSFGVLLLSSPPSFLESWHLLAPSFMCATPSLFACRRATTYVNTHQHSSIGDIASTRRLLPCVACRFSLRCRHAPLQLQVPVMSDPSLRLCRHLARCLAQFLVPGSTTL